MDEFCSSPFWDENLSWNTTTPIFTTCFLKITFLWGPVAFFWLFVPVEIYFIYNSKQQKVPWSALNITKVVGVVFLLFVSSFDMAYQIILYTKISVPPVDYYTPFLIFATMIAVLCIIFFMLKRGVITSGVLFFFWLFLAIGTGANYYVAMQKIFNGKFDYDPEYEYCQFIAIVLYFGFSLSEATLHCFADWRIKPSEVSKRENPEERASLLSQITFWWFNNMVLLGYQKPLASADMWELSKSNQSEDLQTRFNKYWLPLVEKVKRHYRKLRRSLTRTYSKKSDYFSNEINNSASSWDKGFPHLSILQPILKTFGLELLCTGFLNMVASVITFANPILLDSLIAFVSGDEPYWHGFCYAGGMFLVALIESFLKSQYEYKISRTAMRIRSCTISVIYKKALTLSTAARKDFTVGEVVNLMAVDTQRMMEFVQTGFLLLTAPIQLVIALYLLWQQLGISTVGGLAVMMLLLPINAVLTVSIKKSQVLLMRNKDCRIKLMNEILNGIKVLKLYAWENSFIRQAMGIRSKEMDSLRFQAYMKGALTFVFISVPYLVSLASFATFVLIDKDNILDANRAFVSLSLFNILRFPTSILPNVATKTILFMVSLKRINNYLQSEDLDPDIIQNDPFEKDPIVIEDGTFSWTKEEEPTLRDINFRVTEGSLVAVVGKVGTGKSSLLSALLGEMVKCSGRINVKGSVAYVPQQPWIQNATLRKNVLFIKEYSSKYYKEVLEACALMPDIEILPAGDQTEIGEKGINLSGGQKQRIGLARAVYTDADIYYLDDPLSAVDVHVGKHIFDKIIGPQGILKNKARILVTHRISVLPEVDTIVVMQEGKVSEVGSYRELLAKKGAFADFLVEYLQETAAESPDSIPPEEFNLVEEIVATVGISPDLARQLSIRSDGGGNSDSTSTNKMERTTSVTSSESREFLRKRSISQKGTPRDDFIVKKSSVSVAKSEEGKQSKLIQKEAIEVGSVKSSVYLDYMKSYGLWNAFWTLFGFCVQMAFNVGSSLWLSAWSNDALDPTTVGDVRLRNLRLGVYGGLGGFELTFVFISVLVLNLSCLRAANFLHEAMLNHLMRAPMSFFDTTPVGRILNRLSRDIDTVDVILRLNFRILLITSLRALSVVIIISLETPYLILACLPLAVLYYFLQKFYIPTSRQLKRLESITRSPIYSHFSETLTGASCIRAFNAERSFMLQSNQLVDTNNESYYASLAAKRWLSIRLEFFGYSIVLMSALFAVLTRSTMSPGIVGLSVSYALQVTGILNRLVRTTADVETNLVSVERCFEYTRTPTEADWENAETKPNTSWPEKGSISFDHYSTRYRKNLDLVLKGVTCNISPKERCGIVGRTGAGKSSLTLGLFRIIEAAEGRIVIDGTEISKIGLHDLRSRLTIIPQDPVLFTGSLRMNLDPFEFYTDDALWLALEQAHLKSFVQSLEKGLQHEISEGGENLSVGQCQMVCLARALLRKSKILVLDEATAAVDLETDELIQSTIRSEFDDCTVLTIAHRLNTIMDYDKVIVLDKGKIKEMDKPENLLKDSNSVFYAMAKDAGLI